MNVPAKYICFVCVFVCSLNFLFAQEIVTEKILNEQILNSKSDTNKARLYGELAWELKFSKPNDAIQYAQKEIDLGYQYKNSLLLTQGYRAKALSYVPLNEITKALDNYDSCMNYAKIGKHTYYEASCNSLIAGLYQDHGDYDKAIYYYTQGLAVAKKSNNKKILATLSNNLADAYLCAGRNTLLIQENFKLALKCNEEVQDKWNVCFSAGNLAVEYANVKQYDSMNKYINIATKIFAYENKNPYAKASVCNQISHIYFVKNEPEKVIPYAKMSISILDSLNRKDNVLHPISLLMNAYFIIGNLPEAERIANELLVKAKDRNAKLYIKDACKTLSDINKQKKDYAKALYYFEQYKNWNDSMFSIARDQSISNIETKTKLAEKEFESKFKAKQKDEINNKLNEQNNKLFIQKTIAIIAGVLLLITSILLFFANKKKQILHNQLLEEKNLIDKQAKEKLILLSEIHHRVKNNLTMLKSLFYLQARATKNEDIKMILAESQTRIQSMALVHKHLYNESDHVSMNFSDFLHSLLSELKNSFLDKSRNIYIEVNGSCQEIDTEKAIPLALIMNELVTNSLKYAFVNSEDGKIIINISQDKNILHIKYLDNGVGLAKEFDINKGGFGTKIMNILSKQIDATINYEKTIDYSIFNITLAL